MQTYEILVKNRAVVGNSRDMTLVRTSVGIDRVHILFDNAEWLDFPITITFAQGDTKTTEALVVSGLDSVEWVAEAACNIPWEVIQKTGPIRVTLQGTDASGNHIITAKGAPLAVEEAGDVVEGEDPSDAPTVSEWRQAMADAMTAVNNAATLVNTLQENLDNMIAEAQASIDQYVLPIASSDTLGGIKVGNNLSIAADGTLSATASSGSSSTTEGIPFTEEHLAVLRNLQLLASYAFDTDFIGGVLQNTVMIKPKSLPTAKINAIGAMKVDDETVKVATDGTVTVPRYTLPVATAEVLGGVKPDGVTILNNEGAVSVPTADPETLGVVRPDGVTVTIENGVLTASGGGEGGSYILPKATEAQLGGVKVDGTTIGVVDGVISVIVKNAAEEEY